MKRIFFVMAITAILFSCSSKKSDEESSDQKTAETEYDNSSYLKSSTVEPMTADQGNAATPSYGPSYWYVRSTS